MRAGAIYDDATVSIRQEYKEQEVLPLMRKASYILAACIENATNRTKDKEVLGDAR
jgi:hypothetical protein